MSLKQSRRSVSITGATYGRLRQHCIAVDRSMSDVVEELLAKLLGTAKPASAKELSAAAAARPAPRPREAVTPSEARERKLPNRLRFDRGPAPKPAPVEKRAPDPIFGENDPERARPKPAPATTQSRGLDGFDRALEMVRR